MKTARITLPGGECPVTAGLATSPWSRLRGFMLRRRIAPDEALLFPRCDSIHTFGMLTAIDVVFLRDGIIRRIVHSARPNRVFRERGCDALELAPGRAASTGLGEGMRVELEQP